MTLICELVAAPLVVGVVSGIISAYVVRFFDRRKNNRHD